MGGEAADSHDRAPRRRVSAAAAIALLYLGLAIASTWPLAAHLSESLPQGTDTSATVPFFQAWSLWWTSDRAAAGFAGLWDAPIFFPTQRAFLFSDPLLLLGLLASPVLWLGGSPALAHNLVLLAALLANGGMGFGLLRALGLRTPAAVGGGAMLLLLPYVHHELGVLMLVPLAGLLATLWALWRLAQRPSLGTGCLLGLAAAATYLTCGQYGIFIALVIAPASLWLARRELLTRQTARALAAALVLAGLLVAPLVVAQIAALGEHHFARGEATALKGASYPDAWLATPWPQLVPLPGVAPVAEGWMQGHFPGSLKLALALIGVAWGLAQRRWRRWAAFLLTGALLASLLSALPRLALGDVSPYRALRDWVPGLAQMRAYWRFIAVAQLCVALSAALGIQALLELARTRFGRTSETLLAGLALALGLLASVELWPPRQHLARAPDLASWHAVHAWLREHVEPETALLHLPLPRSMRAPDLEETSRWMYLMAGHGLPMANGYSGFFPSSYRMLARAVGSCPSPELYARLPALRLPVVVIRSSWLTERPACAPPQPAWTRELRDDALDVEIWRASESAREGG